MPDPSPQEMNMKLIYIYEMQDCHIFHRILRHLMDVQLVQIKNLTIEISIGFSLIKLIFIFPFASIYPIDWSLVVWHDFICLVQL